MDHVKPKRTPQNGNVLEGEIFLQNLPSIVTAHALACPGGFPVMEIAYRSLQWLSSISWSLHVVLSFQ
ncbi:hypothetical protein CFP56_043337 [Quercus suber]|uniref:Uncharacterized protein n=1 Tax=Quercus suber TaxID=58331 RepID=A0AAW0LGV4_QUESU